MKRAVPDGIIHSHRAGKNGRAVDNTYRLINVLYTFNEYIKMDKLCVYAS